MNTLQVSIMYVKYEDVVHNSPVRGLFNICQCRTDKQNVSRVYFTNKRLNAATIWQDFFKILNLIYIKLVREEALEHLSICLINENFSMTKEFLFFFWS